MRITRERFSKALLRKAIERRIEQLESEWRFDPNNGTAQLRGKSPEAHVAYGKLDILQWLLEEFEL